MRLFFDGYAETIPTAVTKTSRDKTDAVAPGAANAGQQALRKTTERMNRTSIDKIDAITPANAAQRKRKKVIGHATDNTDSGATVDGQAKVPKIARRQQLIVGTDNIDSGQQTCVPACAKITRRRLSTIPFNTKAKTCLVCGKRFISAEIDELCDNCRSRMK